MPRRDPFTTLCRQTATRPTLDRADLHLHTVHSDGTYTSAEVVNLALRSGLCAIALTDHDTLDGIEPARRAAAGTGLEIVPAVEITAEHEGRELHLLAYFVSTECLSLQKALQRLRELRVGRFQAMIDRLRTAGVAVDEGLLPTSGVPGRRHLAAMLVRSRQVGTVREAFLRYLHDGGRADVPKQRLPVQEALACVRDARGVGSLAHPPDRVSRMELLALKALGLRAVEADYPSFRAGRVKELKLLARELGLATTGGSDCHGPDSPRRSIGACTMSRQELETLRECTSN